MRAVVIGAGIGGLTSAIALGRAGVDVAVFERAAQLRDVQVGGAIHLWHNGMRALQRLGLGERVRELGGPGAVLARTEFCTRSGRRLLGWGVQETEARLGAPTIGVIRPALHAVLVEALGAESITLGSACTEFVQDAGGVTVHFADGRTSHGDVLVGADGIRSTVRSQLLGDGEPGYAGYTSFQGLTEFPTERAPIGLLRVVFGRGARFLFYRVSDSQLYWEGIVGMEAGGLVSESERKSAVLERFRGWADPVEAILEATEDRAVSQVEIFARAPSKKWGEGRVTLLGDAAHPMTNAMGQGANQALEDALVLSRFSTELQDPIAALRAYEARRIPRTTHFTNMSAKLTRAALARNPAACALRDTALRAAGPMIARSQAKDMDAEL